MNDDESSLRSPILQHQQQEKEEVRKEGPTSREFDGFFCKMYSYYYHRGLVPICLFETTGLINLAFLGCVTSWLCFVDFSKVMAGCGESDATCEGDLGDFVSGSLYEFSPMYRLLTLGYILLFAAFFLYRCTEATSTVLDAFYIANFCRETLGRKAGEIDELPWSDIVEHIMELHRQGLCLINSKPCIDELEITGRIMRKQNYLIALINRDVLDLKVPWYLSLLLNADKVHLTQSLEWSIHYCLLDVMHNDCLNLSATFLRDKEGLARKFVLVGCINLLLTPFILVLMSMQFFLSNAQQSYSSHLLSRRWTSLALWRFREFNELPHTFEQRMHEACEPASEYIRSCSKSHNLAIILKCVQFISGSFVALLLLCSVLKEEALLFIHLGSHNLLWWLGLWSSIYVASRAYTRGDADDQGDQAATTHCGFRSYAFFPAHQQQQQAAHSRPDALIEKICAHTHYYPKRWRADAGSGAGASGLGGSSARFVLVRDELDALFPQKILIFAYEVLSVVLTPVILCFSLPPCAPRIIAFVKRHTTYLPGMGAVLDYSLFDFDKYTPCAGGPDEGAAAAVVPSPLSSSSAAAPAAPAAAASDSTAPAAPEAAWREASSDSDSASDPAADLKLEKSYLSFRQSYPHWAGQRSLRGETLIDRVASFRESRERERDGAADKTEEDMFFSCLLAQSAHPGLGRHVGGASGSHSRMTQSVQLTKSRLWGGGWDGGDSQQQSQGQGRGPGEADLRKILLSVLAAEKIDHENDHYWLNLFSSDPHRGKADDPTFLSV